MTQCPVFIKGKDNLPDIIERQHGRIGVAAINNYLQRRRPSPVQIFGELLPDMEHQQGLAGIKQRRNFRIVTDRPVADKDIGAGKTGQQLPGFHAPVLVKDDIVDMIELKAGRIAKNDQLGHRRHNQYHSGLLVGEQSAELLDHQGKNTTKHQDHSRSLL